MRISSLIQRLKKLKFLILIFVALSLLGLLSLNSIKSAIQIQRQTQLQLFGARYHAALYQLLTDLSNPLALIVNHQNAIDAPNSTLNQHVSLIETLLKEASQFHELEVQSLNSDWTTLKASLKTAFSSPLSPQSESLRAQQLGTIAQLENHMSMVVLQTDLIYDTDKTTYSSRHLITQLIPSVTSLLAQANLKLSSPTNTTSSPIKIHEQTLAEILVKLDAFKQDFTVLNNHLHQPAKAPSTSLNDFSIEITSIASVSQALQNSDTPPTAQANQTSEKAIQAAMNILTQSYQRHHENVIQQLHKRASADTQDLLLTISISILTGFAIVGFYVFSRRVVTKHLETARRLNTIYETVIDAIIIINERGTIQSTNQATTKMFGYSPAEMQGKNINMLMPEPYKSAHDGYLRNYLTTGEAKVIGIGREVVAQRKDGTIFPIDLAITETEIDKKRTFVGTIRDNSERRQIERLYRLMSENVEGYATLILDVNGTIKTWNSGAQTLKGYTEEEVVGKSFTIFYPPEELEKDTAKRLLDSCLSDGHVHTEGWRVKKNGTQFYADIVMNRITDIDGRTLGIVKVTRDITERQKAEIELRQAYANLEEFTAVASHDLKSPIRGISDLAEWIKEDLGETIPESVKNNLDRIQLRVQRMETLIEDLLQYSKAGKVSAEMSHIQPMALINEILDIQPLPEGFNIRVTGESIPFVGAKTPLQTSLRNIISNSVKHHDKAEGNIQIDILYQGSYCIFSVEDDGPGIPEVAQERVFKLFQTLSKTAKSSGIGLAFTKRMIEAHGGKIELESHDQKRGTIFRIFWPRFSIATSIEN